MLARRPSRDELPQPSINHPLGRILRRDPVRLRSTEDLLKPQFREKIAILDPRGPSAGSNQLVAYRKAFGDEWVRRLMVDKEPVLTGDRRQITDWLVRTIQNWSGERPRLAPEDRPVLPVVATVP